MTDPQSIVNLHRAALHDQIEEHQKAIDRLLIELNSDEFRRFVERLVAMGWRAEAVPEGRVSFDRTSLQPNWSLGPTWCWVIVPPETTKIIGSASIDDFDGPTVAEGEYRGAQRWRNTELVEVPSPRGKSEYEAWHKAYDAYRHLIANGKRWVLYTQEFMDRLMADMPDAAA